MTSDSHFCNFDTQTVSARELHERLNIGTEFRKWFPRMCDYGFTEGEDFERVSQKCPTPGGVQEIVDYNISIDMAKEICMIQRTKDKTAPCTVSQFSKLICVAVANYVCYYVLQVVAVSLEI